MLIAFYPPMPVRGARRTYAWVMYLAMSRTDASELGFIASPEYLEPGWPRDADDWAARPSTVARFGYRLPSPADLDARVRYAIDPAVLHPLRDRLGEPDRVWPHTITERDLDLEAAFSRALDAIEQDHAVEAVLLWTPCASVSHVARLRGVSVVHNELGPLRPPDYAATAYFDRSGLTGGTEAAARFAAFRDVAADLAIFDRARLLDLLGFAPEPPTTPEFELGVALQVPDDATVLAYGRGFDTASTLAFARRRHADGSVLVRRHPDAPLADVGDLPVDDSADAAAFIGRVRTLLTINSSTAFEALLHGKDVIVLGESSVAVAAIDPVTGRRGLDDEDLRLWLNFYAMSYLVPWPFLFSAEYCRWRLTNPGEAAIHRRHLDHWLGSSRAV